MKITILPQGTMAIYEQIVNQLKNEIVTGELTPGEALPSIRMLAADLSVSVITTKRAYEELEKEGLIRSVAGKGFYVCESNKDYLKENGDYMYNAGAGNCAKIKTSADRNADSGGYPERGSCCKPFYPVVVGDHDGTGSEKTDPAYNLCSHA